MKEPGTWPPSCFSSSCQAGWKAEPRVHLPEPVCNDEKEEDGDDDGEDSGVDDEDGGDDLAFKN